MYDNSSSTVSDILQSRANIKLLESRSIICVSVRRRPIENLHESTTAMLTELLFYSFVKYWVYRMQLAVPA